MTDKRNYKSYIKKLDDLSSSLNKFKLTIDNSDTIDEDELRMLKMISHVVDIFVAVKQNNEITIYDIQEAYNNACNKNQDTNTDTNSSNKESFGNGFDTSNIEIPKPPPVEVKDEPEFVDIYDKEKSETYLNAISNTLVELNNLRNNRFFNISHCNDETDTLSDSDSDSDSDSEIETSEPGLDNKILIDNESECEQSITITEHKIDHLSDNILRLRKTIAINADQISL